MATIYGTTGSDRRNGTSGSDNIYGWARGGNANSPSGNDTLNGNAGNDNLFGGTGNDTLHGGLGIDSLLGGLGNDIYLVDSTNDRITENSLQGTDTVKSSVRWTLGNNLENLIITAPGNINGSGNSLNNRLTGNAANNTLYGFDGNDLLYGESGNDNLSGGNGNDTSYGGAGNDTLIGILGNDRLYGETGNDTYEVDSTSDIITEYSGQGTDTVKSSMDWTLGANLENLTLTGTSAINGTGNTLNNTITGNGANNVLNGGGGSDTLNGGLGNDTYIVDSSTDIITGEGPNGGTDTVQSRVSWTLGDYLQNLTLTGTSAINGTGNSLNNTIIGNDAINSLYGGDGNDYLIGYQGGEYGDEPSSAQDTLTGGKGADIFRFYHPSQNVTITDFVVADDTIYVNSLYPAFFDNNSFNYYIGFGIEGFAETASDFAVLTPGAAITPEQFVIGSEARNASDRFIYNQNTGALFFDTDGTGADYQQQFALLSPGLSMTNTDIFVTYF